MTTSNSNSAAPSLHNSPTRVNITTVVDSKPNDDSPALASSNSSTILSPTSTSTVATPTTTTRRPHQQQQLQQQQQNRNSYQQLCSIIDGIYFGLLEKNCVKLAIDDCNLLSLRLFPSYNDTETTVKEHEGKDVLLLIDLFFD